ncbi:MAG: hypothetical protein Kow0025_20880 [Thermodesulfovibrionales bacterium]
MRIGSPRGAAAALALILWLFLSPAAAEGPALTGAVEITVEDAILMALENNRSLRVERFNPRIVRTGEEEERAVFDPALSADVSASRDKSTRISTGGSVFERESTSAEAGVEVSRFFSTGTRLGLEMSVSRLYSDLSPDQHRPRVGLSLTQALLEGRGRDVNLASLRQAALDTEISEFELRAFAEDLVAGVEGAYWDYYLAGRRLDIFGESLRLAQRQMKETEERIEVGVLAESELAAAQAEVALRREDLINARSELEKARLRLLRLLSPPSGRDRGGLWNRSLALLDTPEAPALALEPAESHVEVAREMRPVLNQARLQARRGELEVVKTKNGLLPVLDFFVRAGKSGYADSFGGAVKEMDGGFYDISAGLSLELPIRNRSARAAHSRAVLGHEQSLEALDNLLELVEMEVRIAYIEVSRTREQISATEATRRFQEEKLRVETEKFHVGRSTMFLVAQAQRDLLESRIAEAEAVVNHLKALVELYRLEGSLLERRGVAAPGKSLEEGA